MVFPPPERSKTSMSDQKQFRSHDRWAHLRFSIVGPLLAAPPEHGELRAELERLSRKQWLHPIERKPVQFGASTIERWYYAARAADNDPVGILRRAVRKDSGQHRSLGEDLRRAVEMQYKAHKNWSFLLHYDNLLALTELDARHLSIPSYSTILRYMKNHNFIRKSLPRNKNTPGLVKAEQRLESREVRSYESEYVNGLWHLDFHQGSLKVMTPEGKWKKPQLLGILDDHSRLACHLQWYLDETAEDLVHGLCQAFLKRGLPRSLMSDNGAAMIADETGQGLLRMGIIHETTLPYSPYQNGKQESFWGQVEGRLLAMLDKHPDLTLPFLNETTQAWVEMEYNRTVHSETGHTPLARFIESRDVGRPCASPDDLRLAFCKETSRIQRRSDGTISLNGIRFEIPSRFRHFRSVTVRYASWNLARVHLTDPRSGTVLARIYPLDRARNADGLRKTLAPVDTGAQDATAAETSTDMAPLLRKLLADYSATGLPPAYLPKTTHEEIL
jgi:putative transposase